VSPALREKYSRLESILREMGGVVIGYSGGVDSTLLVKVARDVLGEKALAVIGRSATYPSREYEEAVRVALAIGAAFIEVDTGETDVLKFRENPVNRCYYCKTELFSKLGEVAGARGIPWIADGAITDDLGDFRPGRRAGEEQSVRSPLVEAGFSKADVRELSRHLDLPTWDKGSFACLSSRFPYGMPISLEALSKIDAAENLLRDIGFREFRVRYHDERTARIEVGAKEIWNAVRDENRAMIVARLRELGFTYVTLDLQGYRTGSMNEAVSLPATIELSPGPPFSGS
jgi:pyridinium-3,5-biscarboxylic acid mononucleotide sulfurtransferase